MTSSSSSRRNVRSRFQSKGNVVRKTHRELKIITAVDTGITGYSNKDFQNEIATSTLEEFGEMLDNFEKMFLGSGELVERYKTSSVNFDGKYALHMSLLRKSFAGGRSDVHLEGYVFVVNGQMFFITASYRTDAENLYAPVIEKMISSIKILIEDGTDVDGSLYEQTIPWVDSVKFLWPRENIEWKTTAEDGATSKSADFSDIYHLGLTCNLTVVNSDIAVNKAGQSESLQYMKDSLVSKIKNMFKGYNIVITRNTISDGKAYIDYTYSADGVSAYDSMYIRFADTRRIVMLTVERLAYNNPVFNNIVESLGF